MIKRRVLSFKILLAMLLITNFVFSSNSQIDMIIKKDSDLNSIVPYEIIEYKIYIKNLTTEPLSNIRLIIKTDKGLLVVVNSKEFEEREFYIQKIDVNQQESIGFGIKNDGTMKGKLKFKIVLIVGNKQEKEEYLEIEAKEHKILIRDEIYISDVIEESGKKAIYKFELENISEEDLKKVYIVGEGSEGIYHQPDAIKYDILAKKQKTPEKEYIFYYRDDDFLTKYFTLKVVYEDSDGYHFLEKNYYVKNKKNYAFLLVGLAMIVLSAGVYYFMKTRKEENN